MTRSLRKALQTRFEKVKKVARDSYLVEDFLSPEEAVKVLEKVDGEVEYRSRDDPSLQFKIFGHTRQMPRDKAFYGQVEVDLNQPPEQQRVEPFYKYAKDVPPVDCWFGMHLETMADQIQESSGQACNHVVVNQYRSGDDYIGDHRDKDASFEPGSSVMTVSLGAERMFRLKKFKGRDAGEVIKFTLPVGSLFVLGPKTNAKWKHSILKSKQAMGRRVSLTYRAIAHRRSSRLEEKLD